MRLHKSMIARIIIASLLSFSVAALAQRAPGGPGDLVTGAGPNDVRLMVTGAIEIPIEAIRNQLEKDVGRHLVIQYGSARGNLKSQILAGQTFEVAILLSDVTDQLLAAGKTAPGAIEVARVEIALGQRGDAPLVDVSNPAALKKALLGAKSLIWLPTGVAINTVNKILDTLDIREAVKATQHTHPRETPPMAKGEYEIQIYPLSEILGNKPTGVSNLGPVMPSLQVPAVITAAISSGTRDQRSADIVLAYLKGPAMDQALKASGMAR